MCVGAVGALDGIWIGSVIALLHYCSVWMVLRSMFGGMFGGMFDGMFDGMFCRVSDSMLDSIVRRHA